MSTPDVRSFTVGPVQENCYIVRADKVSSRALIVDPGDEPERLLEAADELGVKIEAILLTHTHFDHIGAVAPIARATGAPVYCPKIERAVLADVMRWVPPGFGPFESYEADHTLAGGEQLELAGLPVEVRGTAPAISPT
jgi:glyoxylase-like metal-dependent hydrolase (beta-lactamase superfamily II)